MGEHRAEHAITLLNGVCPCLSYSCPPIFSPRLRLLPELQARRCSQTYCPSPPPTTWVGGLKASLESSSPLDSPHAPHLEADITPFATQTGEEEKDEGQQAGAGNEDHGVGRSQRGPAQGESICGHKTGLGSRLQALNSPDSMPLPSWPRVTTTPIMLCNQGLLGRGAGWPRALWEL